MKNEEGYTLPELVAVMVVTGLLIGLIMTFLFSYWRFGSLMEADMDTLVTRLNAGDNLRENLSTSTGLINQNSLPDAHPNNPDPNDASGNYWEPIHAIPGTISVGGSGTTPLIYFSRFSFNSTNEIIMNGNQPYENEYVLYIDHPTKELRMRRIADTNASGNRMVATCPPEIATASCPKDRVIASDLSSVSTRYFSRTGNTIDYTSVYDSETNTYIGPDFPVVEVVEIKLNLAKKPRFQKDDATQNSTVIRVALRNK